MDPHSTVCRVSGCDSQSTHLLLTPIVFSWLVRRGVDATRLDPHDAPSRRVRAARLAALLVDERLFTEWIDQRGWSGCA